MTHRSAAKVRYVVSPCLTFMRALERLPQLLGVLIVRRPDRRARDRLARRQMEQALHAADTWNLAREVDDFTEGLRVVKVPGQVRHAIDHVDHEVVRTRSGRSSSLTRTCPAMRMSFASPAPRIRLHILGGTSDGSRG